MGGMAKQDTQYIPKFKSATAPGLALAREPLDESIAATRDEQCWMSPYPCDWALGLLLRPTGRRSLDNEEAHRHHAACPLDIGSLLARLRHFCCLLSHLLLPRLGRLHLGRLHLRDLNVALPHRQGIRAEAGQ